MELWDIYDKDRQPTGRTMVRGEPFDDGAYHLVVHICLFNAAGQMLIQHRQPFKSGWSNLWDITVGGSAVAGDSSRAAAEREVKEEIGYQLDLTDVRPSLTVHFAHGFDDYYLLKREVDPSALSLQPEEVKEVKWATEAEIMALIDEKVFIPYRKSFISLLFAMKENGSVRFEGDTTQPLLN